MDILIKNFELPQDEGVFICICPNGSVQVQVGCVGDSPVYNIAKGVEAVAIPEHGDLIERDKLVVSIIGEHKTDHMLGSFIYDAIMNAPTVLEASNE